MISYNLKTKNEEISGEEFIEAILNGERNLSRIKLEKNCDLTRCERFPDLQEYFVQDGYKDRIDISYSELKGVIARKIDWCFVIAKGTDLEGADLSGADLYRAKLGGANLKGARLAGANLWGADLSGADLTGAYLIEANLTEAVLDNADLTKAELQKANLYNARFLETKLVEADLRDVENLKTVRYLGTAYIYRTKVGQKEKAVFEKVLKLKF
jgi:uncharacterized protein YjbI with pentapeptide repeats